MSRLGRSQVSAMAVVPIERRAYARHPARGNVLCSLLGERADSVNQPTISGRLVDLSRNGALVDVPERLEAGTSLRLEFYTPGGTLCFAALAEVRAVAPRSGDRWQAGCAFQTPVDAAAVAPFTA